MGANQTSFKEGDCPNPEGRPKGSQNAMTALREQFQAAAPEIVAQVLEKAQAGDDQMMKLALERILPKKREETYVSIPNFKGSDYKGKCKALDSALHNEIISVEIANTMNGIINRRYEIEVLRSDNERLHRELVEIKEALMR